MAYYINTSWCFFSKIVDKIDADEDGFVTEAELKAWIKKAQKKYIYDNVERQWKDFDINNDGMISWDEYKNVTYGSYLGKILVFFQPDLLSFCLVTNFKSLMLSSFMKSMCF